MHIDIVACSKKYLKYLPFLLVLVAIAAVADPSSTNSNSSNLNQLLGQLRGPTVGDFDFPSFDQMLDQLSRQIPYLNQLISAAAYVVGFGIMFKAMYDLKKYGEARTMMSNNADFRGPIIMLATGTFMLFFPQFIDVGLTTIFGSANILQYDTTSNANWDHLRSVIVQIVQFLGAVAVFRGVLFIYRVGTGQAQQGTLGRGFAHCIGGVLCLNIVAAKNILYGTLGILQVTSSGS